MEVHMSIGEKVMSDRDYVAISWHSHGVPEVASTPSRDGSYQVTFHTRGEYCIGLTVWLTLQQAEHIVSEIWTREEQRTMAGLGEGEEGAATCREKLAES
jgi:hypothetical protein